MCSLLSCAGVSSAESRSHLATEAIGITYVTGPSCAELFSSNEAQAFTIPVNGDPAILQSNFSGGCGLITLSGPIDSESDLVVELASNHPKEVIFWTESDGELTVSKDTPVNERPLGHRYFAAKIPLAGKHRELKIIIKQRGVFNAPLYVYTQDNFERVDRISFLLGGIFIGTLCIATLASLILISMSGRIVFLGYLGLVVAGALMVLAKTGLGQAVLWLDHPNLTDHAISLSVPIAVFSVIWILWFGLNAMRLAPVMYRGLILVSAFAVTNFVVGNLFSLNQLENKVQVFLLGPFLFFLIMVLYLCAKERRDESWNLAIAISCLAGGVSIGVLSNLGLIKDSLWALRAAEIGATLSALAGVSMAFLRLRNDRKIANSLAEELARLRDSRERELTEEISKKTSWLEDLSAEKERLLEEFFSFSRFLAHDLRNPLANIASQNLLIRKKYPDEYPVQKGTAKIQKCVTRISNMFGDWLVAQRLSLNYHKLEIAEFRVCDLLNEVLSETDWSSDIVVKSGAVSESQTVNWDKSLIKRVIHNLLDNITKHACSEKGAEIQLEIDRELGYLSILVRDFGPMRYEDFCEHIGYRFGRTVTGVDRAPSGEVGLGLSFIDKVVGKHCGAISFHPSMKDHGLIVKLRMPLNVRNDD